MGLFDFIKDAGDKIFGGDDDKAPQARDLDDVLADKRTSSHITNMITRMEMGVENLDVKFREGKATIAGKVASQAEREKIVLLAGNTQGVAQVEDLLEIQAAPEAPPEPEATMYTVKSGDSLSKIAKAHYGDPMKYTIIFEANQPMLKDPDRIYPGQVLRIPPQP